MNRIEYWINRFNNEIENMKVTNEEQKELRDILKKLYEDNKMIYEGEGEFARE